jgi:hypothetical protein
MRVYDRHILKIGSFVDIEKKDQENLAGFATSRLRLIVSEKPSAPK